MARLRKAMRASIDRLLLPELQARGFRRDPGTEPDDEMPWGTLSRTGRRGRDRIVIAFDRHRPGHFTLCLSVLPDPLPADPHADVLAVYELAQRGGYFRKPFGATVGKGEQPSAADHDKAVLDVVEALAEIEAFFAAGTVSRRMRRTVPKVYGFGSHRYHAGTWIFHAVPLVLVGLLAAAFQSRLPWLLGSVPFVVLALAAWLWLLWVAHRR